MKNTIIPPGSDRIKIPLKMDEGKITWGLFIS